MKKAFLLLCVLLPIVLTSCKASSSETKHNQFEITLRDVFKHYHYASADQFELITQELSNVKDQEGLSYISGLIEGDSITNPLLLPSAIFTNEETKQIITDEQLQSDIVTLYQIRMKYISHLESLIKEKELKEIQRKQDEFRKLSALMHRINDNRLFSNDKSKIDSYKKDLESVISEISGVLGISLQSDN